MPHRPRVAIIGAGAAGLCLARELLSNGHAVTIYEAQKDIGGTWAYSPIPSVSSALYESLHCNIPNPVMAFSNKRFPPGVPTFAHHTEVLAYLKEYVEEHDLRRHILFNTRVTSVRKVSDVWIVRANDREQAFGAVAVAIGHYTTPNPWMPQGAEQFCQNGRRIVHSHSYKTPQPFENRRVLVAGAGPSGTDIALELAGMGAEVVMAHSGWRDNILQGYVREIAKLERVTGDGKAISEEGQTVDVDDVVLCTGFQYTYPFFKNGEAGIHVADDNRSVRGLMGHLYAKQDPTLAFMGLVWRVVPFPLFEDQAAFLAALWGGNISSRRLAEFERIEDRDWDTAMKGEPRFLHRMGDHQWEYRRRLCDACGRLVPAVSAMEVYKDAWAARRRSLRNYRQREYVILGRGPGEWRAFVDGVDVTGREDPASPSAVASVADS